MARAGQSQLQCASLGIGSQGLQSAFGDPVPNCGNVENRLRTGYPRKAVTHRCTAEGPILIGRKLDHQTGEIRMLTGIDPCGISQGRTRQQDE